MVHSFCPGSLHRTEGGHRAGPLEGGRLSHAIGESSRCLLLELTRLPVPSTSASCRCVHTRLCAPDPRFGKFDHVVLGEGKAKKKKYFLLLAFWLEAV